MKGMVETALLDATIQGVRTETTKGKTGFLNIEGGGNGGIHKGDM